MNGANRLVLAHFWAAFATFAGAIVLIAAAVGFLWLPALQGSGSPNL